MDSSAKPEQKDLEEFLQHVRALRHDWSDDIPDEILHSDSMPGGPKFKARKNWFNIFVGWLSVGVYKNYLPSEFEDRYRKFNQYMHDTDFRKRHTIREDIDKVNGMLDEIISYLERPK
ncbi:MAG: hypothetical protein KJ574_00225 [Nanoarchaeota archaeon]|nr:hypothetical protein [Nanoarchaeota archaeon]